MRSPSSLGLVLLLASIAIVAVAAGGPPGNRVDGGWCSYSSCSVTCGTGGVQTRTCECPAPARGGDDCHGPSQRQCPDQLPECIPDINGGWCPPTNCSATCGGGTQTRTCACPPPSGNGATCAGSSTLTCNTQGCPVNGGWCPLSNCTTTCGTGGTQTRTCACPAPANGGAACEGASTVPCTGLPECIPDVNGGWCPFTNCSATCGGGTQTRTCACPPPQGNGAQCEGSSSQPCNSQTCPVPVNGGWCPLSNCTTTCGTGGTQTRTCACPAPANGGAACEGPSTVPCTGLPECIPDVNGGWCPFSNCSVTCGLGGVETRSCTCPPPQGNGAQCQGNSARACSATLPACIPNTDGGWCPYSNCSATCGGGTKTRTCACPAPSGTGATCQGTSSTSCNTQSCTVPTDGGWCPLSDCTTTCGTGGTQTRTCACPAPANGGAGCEGPSEVECTGLPECIPDVNGGWCPYSNCSATCGGGTQTRTCACPPPQGNGAQCEGSSSQPCNTQSCTVPTDGGWCPLSDCTTTCGTGGTQTRTCACPAPANGGAACEGPSEVECTGLPECVPDVNGGWCPFTNCSATCGGGTQTRTCACPPPQGDGTPCEGESTQSCNSETCSVAVPCPCGTYSPTGTYIPGTSTCTACPQFSWSREGSDSIDDCKCWSGYEKQEDGSCEPTVDVDGGWCPLSDCSVSCGCGVRTRTCACPAPSGRGKDCKGPSEVSCVEDACVGTEVCPQSTYSPTGTYIPGQTECTACPANSWSPAGSDSITDCTCWDGFEGPAGGPCTEVVPSVNGGWCPLTECSATCGGGTQTRVCACPPPQGTGATCSGSSVLECSSCACETEGVPCAQSTYSATGSYIPGQTECTACPEFSWSPVGSDSITDCECWAGYTGPAGGPCTEVEASVNGGWCPLSACNATCDGGFQERVCACPPREGDGADCEGDAVVPCNTDACVQQCPESYYSSTGTFDCRTSRRCRKCPKYSWSPAGSDSKSDCVCWAGYEGPDGGPCRPVTPEVNVNGGWCPATECSATCGGGTQTRTCECPPPQGSGATCAGEATLECNRCPCDEAPTDSLPCPQSTYSDSGMYIPGQTECTPCPESSWSPSGSTNITDCTCWAGFEGPAGGPCTEIVPNVNGGWCPYAACNVTCGGGVQYRTCACPPPEGDGAPCEGSSEAACNTDDCPSPEPQPANTTCADAADADECSSWEGCVALSGYDCNTHDWCAYLGCAASLDDVSQEQTCAVNTETGDRAWFPTAQLPQDFVATTPMGSVRSCCKPRSCNSTTAVTLTGDDGCTYRVGDACVVLQFRGQLPANLTEAEVWATAFFIGLEATLNAGLASLRSLGVDLSQLSNIQLSDYIDIVSGPNPNNATGTYYTTIQIKPLGQAVTLPVSAEQLLAALVDGFNAALQSGQANANDVIDQLQGVASFTQYTADGAVDEKQSPAGTSAADGMRASIVLVLATGVVATIIAKVASFMQ